MSVNENEISLRPVTPADSNFLLAVFASTRTDELAALPDPAIAESFVRMQFNAQQQSCQMAYPKAEHRIIIFRGRPAGRILVDYTAETIRLVDISLLSEFRAQGIGSFLIRRLIGEALDTGKRLMLSVYKFNPALTLYERLGFSKTGEDGLYIQMQLRGGGAQKQPAV